MMCDLCPLDAFWPRPYPALASATQTNCFCKPTTRVNFAAHAGALSLGCKHSHRVRSDDDVHVVACANARADTGGARACFSSIACGERMRPGASFQ
eukprot:6192101-Pleurochrysis_carterae.AAC.1